LNETRAAERIGGALSSERYFTFSSLWAINCGAVNASPQGGKALAAKKSAFRSGK
jgi:hypothetical protein